MTAAEVYESIINGGSSHCPSRRDPRPARTPWCLIGGLAVNHYVEPVYTVDADVVIVAENLEAVQQDLVSAGFRVKSHSPSVNGTKAESQLSLQFTTADRYQPFIDRAERGEILGCTVPVASLPDLVQGKIWAWSDPTRRLSKQMKDELDLVRMGEKYPELRNLLPQEIAKRIEVGARET